MMLSGNRRLRGRGPPSPALVCPPPRPDPALVTRVLVLSEEGPQVPAPPSEAPRSATLAWAEGSRLRVQPWNVTPLSPSGHWCPEDPRPPGPAPVPFAFVCASCRLLPPPRRAPGSWGLSPRNLGIFGAPGAGGGPGGERRPHPSVPYLGLTGPPPPHPQKGGCVLGHEEGVQAWGQGRACAGEGAAAGPTGLPFPGPGTWGGRSGVNPTSQAPWKGRGTEGPSSAAETDLRETQANGFISNIIN